MSTPQKPLPPTPDRRAKARRTAWILGAVALAVYVYAMVLVVKEAA